MFKNHLITHNIFRLTLFNDLIYPDISPPCAQCLALISINLINYKII